MNFLEKYEVVVGLETHVQLLTDSKLFEPARALFTASANEHVSFVTAAHPGTLPVLNEKVIDMAISLGLALNCEIAGTTLFDRKNYFYPDLPKGYQISQDAAPFCRGGSVQIKTESGPQKIPLHHIHIEEDAGKSLHDQDEEHSWVDLNRAGVPLLEIVSEPAIHSSEEAYQYLTEIRKLVQFLGICDGNMEEGSLRCDANISIRKKGDETLGNRCEIKNMNSIRFVKKAIEHEFKRQAALLEKGEIIEVQTRGYDPVSGTTTTQRSKEMAHDYRYFPDPDLPAIFISKERVKRLRNSLPELPAKLEERLQREFGLSEYQAEIIAETRESTNYFLQAARKGKEYSNMANLMINELRSFLNQNNITYADLSLQPAHLAELTTLVATNVLHQHSVKNELLPHLLTSNEIESVKSAAESLNLQSENNEAALEMLVNELLQDHPNEVKAYKNGKKQLLGMFMGLAMKAVPRGSNPKRIKQILEHQLNQT